MPTERRSTPSPQPAAEAGDEASDPRQPTPLAAAPPAVAMGESRWPMATAVIVLIVLTAVPPYGGLGFGPLLAVFEAVLLVTLIIGDPGRIDDRSRRMRRVSTTLVVLVVATSLVGTVALVYRLLTGAQELNSADTLLASGAKAWLVVNIAFALLYWQLDCGGPAERAYRLRPQPDFAFPQELNPQLAAPGWRPRFIDYLYLAISTSTAFSPTDTSPLTRWAKMAMTFQALFSVVIIGLVIARAVNVLN